MQCTVATGEAFKVWWDFNKLYCRLCYWNNFENRSIFDEVKELRNLVAYFSYHPVAVDTRGRTDLRQFICRTPGNVQRNIRGWADAIFSDRPSHLNACLNQWRNDGWLSRRTAVQCARPVLMMASIIVMIELRGNVQALQFAHLKIDISI